LSAGCLAAGQSSKLLKIDRLRPLSCQIRVDEIEVGELIVGIVVDVIGHVVINRLQGFGVSFVPASAGDLVILNSSEFVVLLPKIGLENFGCSKESEDRNIAFG